MIRLLGVHRGTAALLALLTLTASLLVAGLPRALEASLDESAATLLRTSPAQTTALTFSLDGSYAPDRLPSVARIAEWDDRWRARLPLAVRHVVDDTARYSFMTPPMAINGMRNRYMALAWAEGAESRIRYVEGVAPGPTGSPVRFNVGLAATAAAEFGIKVGDTIGLGGYEAMVTGLWEPLAPDDSFWTAYYAGLDKIAKKRELRAEEDELHLTGLANGDALAGGQIPVGYGWTIQVNPSKVTARNAVDVRDGVAEAGRLTDQGKGTSLFTGLDQLITEYLDRLSTTRALMAVLLGGFAVACLGTIALAVRLLGSRMHGSLSLMRARGASLPRVTAVGGGVVALAIAPAALVGAAFSLLVPGPSLPILLLGPVALAVIAIAYACGATAHAHRQPLNERRDDVVTRRPSPRRIALEVLVVLLGVGGVQLLRSRGLGDDPFMMVVPALLTVAAALVALRVYPFPLRLLLRLTARRRDAAPYLGLAMAARAATGATLPVLTLLPALAICAYGAVTADGLATAQRLAAWQQVGAEIRVQRSEGIPADLIERIRRTPGVKEVVPAAVGKTHAEVGFTGRDTAVVAVDLNAYRKLVAGSPLEIPTAPASGALVSSDMAAMASFDITWPEQLTVQPKGKIATLPGVDTTNLGLIVLPALTQHTNTLLISGDAEAVKAAMPAGTVIRTVDGTLTEITSVPLTSSLMTGLRVVTLALAAYALAAVAIMLVSGAAERSRALILLHAIGLTRRQAKGMTVLEIGPVLILAVLAGLALGLGLPTLLGNGIDLSAYAGLRFGDYPIDPVTPALLAGGVAVVALAGVYLGGSRAKSR
ncbi:FtsX-like permease family protein [Microtetraspora sp. NBRC 16547]|uniref:FtsX-like permease family protein n=1 Tax=Microtetraspora sp. NBRC 16547 TaxID=3030993 RepID=UPI0024A10597|nr:FtsX-like permease family protein [Microtetraspora sp. NBRC 16547]GLW97919.1 membrane protein [Microtetraspora sp. NBRC 16547]